MTGVIDLLDDLMAQTDVIITLADRSVDLLEPRACDGCGETRPDVDLWAENSETGEELWLCSTCGEA